MRDAIYDFKYGALLGVGVFFSLFTGIIIGLWLQKWLGSSFEGIISLVSQL